MISPKYKFVKAFNAIFHSATKYEANSFYAFVFSNKFFFLSIFLLLTTGDDSDGGGGLALG